MVDDQKLSVTHFELKLVGGGGGGGGEFINGLMVYFFAVIHGEDQSVHLRTLIGAFVADSQNSFLYQVVRFSSCFIHMRTSAHFVDGFVVCY